jgi:hypothetical protein
MAKPLPAPPVPASTQANRLIRSLQTFAEREARTPEEFAQKVIDLQHLYVTLRDLIDPAYYEAISPRGGGVPFRTMVARTGLAKSAIQRRVDRGADLPPLTLPSGGDDPGGTT